MTLTRSVDTKNVIMGRVGFGADLLRELTALCEGNNITLGWIQAIGAVQKANVGFYDQETREYSYKNLDMPMEILNLTGNVSLKDGKPFVHAHITLADEEGRSFGGHLAEGTIVFACEFILHHFSGAVYTRVFDKDTDLYLWDL